MISLPYQNVETREIVYKVQCSCSKAYVGETGRYLSTRLHEHSHRRDSEVFCHTEQFGHTAQMGSATVLARETEPSRRRILETLLCLDIGVDKLINRKLGQSYLFN